MADSTDTKKQILIDVAGLTIQVNIPYNSELELFQESVDAVEKKAEAEGKSVSDLLTHTLINITRELSNPTKLERHFSLFIAKHFCLRPKDLEKDVVNIDAMMLVGHCGGSKEAIMNIMANDHNIPYISVSLTQGDTEMASLHPVDHMMPYSEVCEYTKEQVKKSQDKDNEALLKSVNNTPIEALMGEQLVVSFEMIKNSTGHLLHAVKVITSIYLELNPNTEINNNTTLNIDIDKLCESLNIKKNPSNFLSRLRPYLKTKLKLEMAKKAHEAIKHKGIDWIESELKRVREPKSVTQEEFELYSTMAPNLHEQPLEQQLKTIRSILLAAKMGSALAEATSKIEQLASEKNSQTPTQSDTIH